MWAWRLGASTSFLPGNSKLTREHQRNCACRSLLATKPDESILSDTFPLSLTREALKPLEVRNKPRTLRPGSPPSLSYNYQALNPEAAAFLDYLHLPYSRKSIDKPVPSIVCPTSTASPAKDTQDAPTGGSGQPAGHPAALPSSSTHRSMCSSASGCGITPRHRPVPWNVAPTNADILAGAERFARAVCISDRDKVRISQTAFPADPTAIVSSAFSPRSRKLWLPENSSALVHAPSWHTDAWDACINPSSHSTCARESASATGTHQDLEPGGTTTAAPKNHSTNTPCAKSSDDFLWHDPADICTSLQPHASESLWKWPRFQAIFPNGSPTTLCDRPQLGASAQQPTASPFEQQPSFPGSDSPNQSDSVQAVNNSDLMRDATLTSILRESGVFDTTRAGVGDPIPVAEDSTHGTSTRRSTLENFKSFPASRVMKMPTPTISSPAQSEASRTAFHAPPHAYLQWPAAVPVSTNSSSQLAECMCKPQPTKEQKRSKSLTVVRGAEKFAQEFPTLGESIASIGAKKKLQESSDRPSLSEKLSSKTQGSCHDNSSEGTADPETHSGGDSAAIPAQWGSPTQTESVQSSRPAAEALPERPRSHQSCMPFMHLGHFEGAHASSGYWRSAQAATQPRFVPWGDVYTGCVPQQLFGPMHGADGARNMFGGKPSRGLRASQQNEHLHNDAVQPCSPQAIQRCSCLSEAQHSIAVHDETHIGDPPQTRGLRTRTSTRSVPAAHMPMMACTPLMTHPPPSMPPAYMWSMRPSMPHAAAGNAAHAGMPTHMQGPMVLVPLSSLQPPR